LKKTRNRFTLIELLVVIGLASLLMTIMLPAFNRMISGNAVDRAASELKLALEQAQSIAASSRKYVAVVFPNGNNALSRWDSSGKLPIRKLASYRLCYVKYDSEKELWEFVNWVPEKMWQKLDRCLIVAAAADEEDVKLEASGGLKAAVRTSVEDLDKCFSGDEKRKPLKKIRKVDGDAGDSTFSAVVFTPTGGLKSGGPAYFAVAEAAFNGNTIVYPVQDGNGYPVNLVCLKIDRFTGAVEYVK